MLRADTASLRVLRELRQFPSAAHEAVHAIALASVPILAARCNNRSMVAEAISGLANTAATR